MAVKPKNLKTCSEGHQFYKSSDCPVCPECEKQRIPVAGFLGMVSAPARRALEREGIVSIEILSTKKESELLKLHGIGPKAIPVLKKVLESSGLSFRG